jgi:hypothetical protein
VKRFAPVLERCLVGAALALGAGAASGALAANAFFDALRAARADLAQGDLSAAHRHFAAVDSMAGGLPASTYGLAQVAARQGNRAEAMRRLEAYAAMGLSRDASRDSSFAALRSNARFQAIAAKLGANAFPMSRATIAASLVDPALLTEDLAYDARTATFYASSIHRGFVVAVDSTGLPRDFLAPGPKGGWGIYGLAIDTSRGLLWGTTAATPTTEQCDLADSGRTAIVAWELGNGRERSRVELPRDGYPHLFGDLAIASDGTLYTTDSIGGGLYRLRPGAARLDTLAGPGAFGSPQMPLVMDAGRTLWIADYPRGILAFDLARRTIRPVPKPRDLAASGIDGMALAPGGLIAIQNGTRPIRVLFLSLDPTRRRITGGRVLEQASKLMGEPNHGIVAKGAFYFIGNSGWERVNAGEHLETPPGTTSPMILKLELPAGRHRTR